jgi:hypothetical protein
MERLDLEKLNELKGKEQYQVKVSKRFATEMSTEPGKLTQSIKTSAKENPDYYKLKQNKPWFNEGCSKLLDKRKRAKLQEG